MNKRQLTSCAALAFALATAAFAQSPPPNDDFANRIVLTGSSLTFTGTLVGSTIESGEGFAQGYYPGPGGGSVWWTWTTPVTTRVVIEILPTPFTTNAELRVHSGTAMNALTSVDQNMFGFPPGRYVSFLAYPTNTYQFRVGGIGTQPFSLRLTATNPPIFIFKPQNCVASPLQSAFFSAMATGPASTNSMITPMPSPTSYQWSFNGVPIPGQISPSLILHNITTNQAGSYSVIASNIGGVTESDPATLTVIDTNPVPQIIALVPTNSIQTRLALAGEPGRWYRIESTPSFPFPFWQLGVHLQLTNSPEIISLSRLDPNHFVRAALDVRTDVCIAQLMQMWWGQKTFAIEARLFPNDALGLLQIKPYLHLTPQGDFYYCPEGGTYAIGGDVKNAATCSLSTAGHRPPVLP
jgi:hypothetical protein